MTFGGGRNKDRCPYVHSTHIVMFVQTFRIAAIDAPIVKLGRRCRLSDRVPRVDREVARGAHQIHVNRFRTRKQPFPGGLLRVLDPLGGY